MFFSATASFISGTALCVIGVARIKQTKASAEVPFTLIPRLSLGIFSAVNSLGQVIGVVIGGIIMIWFDHLAYWIIAAILFVVAYLVLPAKRFLFDYSTSAVK